MNIVFMGTPDFAVPSLKALVEHQFHVVGVFTQPDRPKGRGGKVQKSPVKLYAESQNIPVFQPEKIKNEVELLKSLNPDYCVTAAFGQILSQAVLDVPKGGTINVHASLLPKHRGSAPVQWAIWQGDKVTGVTTMLTDKGIDTGDMLLKKECPIEESDTAETLLQKLSELGANLLIETLQNIHHITPQKQNQAEATYDPMLKKDMGEIDFTQSAETIACQVRAMQPWPKAYLLNESGEMYKITQVKVLGKANAPCGTVVEASAKSGLIIATSTQNLEILKIQAPNKKDMDAKAFLLGNKIATNTHYKHAF